MAEKKVSMPVVIAAVVLVLLVAFWVMRRATAPEPVPTGPENPAAFHQHYQPTPPSGR